MSKEPVRKKLEAEFHYEMLAIYDRALSECGYRASRFRQLVSKVGGFKAARQLLRPGELSEGLSVLFEHGRPDLSMEALVLKEPWAALFAREELNEARRRLGVKEAAKGVS
jgi:hypothetical protein